MDNSILCSREEDEALEEMELGLFRTRRETLFPCGHIANDRSVHENAGECPVCDDEANLLYEYLLDFLLKIPSVFG
jgi:hypothetical protein